MRVEQSNSLSSLIYYCYLEEASYCFLYRFSLSLCQSSTFDLKTKEEKDAELEKRIEALRKKNEALLKRYQVGC